VNVFKKKCEGCQHAYHCHPLKFEFNFFTCKIDCYWKRESFYNNNREFEAWYKNDQWHRDDGPAVVSYDGRGEISYEQWWKNNKLINTILL